MKMRAWLTLIVALLAVAVCFGQAYKPKKGETVLKIEVEGRGNIFIQLYTKEAPQTTEHIIKKVKDNFYDKQRFHRVEKVPRPYLVQIGDPQSKTGDLNTLSTTGKDGKIPYENSGFNHIEGAVGLVRSNVSDLNTGGDQFYIALAPAKFLDGKYTVFGQVVSGMDVAKQIERGDRVISMTILTGQ